MKTTFISSVFLTCIFVFTALVPGCMTDKEWQLRKQSLENQSKYQSIVDAFAVEGPVKIEVLEGGKMKVQVPNQPFKEIAIPDGMKTQEEIVKHLLDIGAITFLGYEAIDKANGVDTIKTSTTVEGE